MYGFEAQFAKPFLRKCDRMSHGFKSDIEFTEPNIQRTPEVTLEEYLNQDYDDPNIIDVEYKIVE